MLDAKLTKWRLKKLKTKNQKYAQRELQSLTHTETNKFILFEVKVIF